MANLFRSMCHIEVVPDTAESLCWTVTVVWTVGGHPYDKTEGWTMGISCNFQSCFGEVQRIMI